MSIFSPMPRLILALLICTHLSAWADEHKWRRVNPDNILIVETDRGEFTIELNIDFAPKHAAHMKALARSGFFDGRDFYRVIENFVVQTGSGDDMAAEGNTETDKFVEAEFSVLGSTKLAFTSAGNGDAYAPLTGYVDGFPVGRDLQTGETWILHCPGLVGMARNEAPDSGGTDWYVVIGQAPRHLDRNISMFGRVVTGMAVLQGMPRGPLAAGGMIPDGEPRASIVRMTVSSDMPETVRPVVEIMDTTSQAFLDRLEGYRVRTHPWYVHTPSEFVNVCAGNVPMRVSYPGAGTSEKAEQQEGSKS